MAGSPLAPTYPLTRLTKVVYSPCRVSGASCSRRHRGGSGTKDGRTGVLLKLREDQAHKASMRSQCSKRGDDLWALGALGHRTYTAHGGNSSNCPGRCVTRCDVHGAARSAAAASPTEEQLRHCSASSWRSLAANTCQSMCSSSIWPAGSRNAVTAPLVSSPQASAWPATIHTGSGATPAGCWDSTSSAVRQRRNWGSAPLAAARTAAGQTWSSIARLA
eukprot:scaffold2405_cov113-Isochrysis_galbana.AAC.2